MQLRERALLYEIQRSFSGVIDLDELLPILIARTKSAFEVESSAILLVDPKTSELYFPHVSDVDSDVERRFASIRVPPGQGIAGWVVEHGETQCVADVRQEADTCVRCRMVGIWVLVISTQFRRAHRSGWRS